MKLEAAALQGEPAQVDFICESQHVQKFCFSWSTEAETRFQSLTCVVPGREVSQSPPPREETDACRDVCAARC